MIAIGSDHGGYKLKEEIKKYLEEKEIEYEDCGTFSEDRADYPEIAKTVALEIQYSIKRMRKRNFNMQIWFRNEHCCK